ncbi:hypothetical protein CDIK_1575 [Cucumispora dikerogammari]|nr:hypothetical protein CDIK_1575 [Cucumispora dikerogammari]
MYILVSYFDVKTYNKYLFSLKHSIHQTLQFKENPVSLSDQLEDYHRMIHEIPKHRILITKYCITRYLILRATLTYSERRYILYLGVKALRYLYTKNIETFFLKRGI